MISKSVDDIVIRAFVFLVAVGVIFAGVALVGFHFITDILRLMDFDPLDCLVDCVVLFVLFGLVVCCSWRVG